MTSQLTRLPHIDALKAAAAQLIVLHHLSAYGPVAAAVQHAAPGLIGWFYQYGRMAVQIFLVVAGFLSARALSPRGQLFAGSPAALIWRRYIRLVPPFMAAVLITLLCSSLVADWLPDLVPLSTSLPQLLAHVLLMHGVLGYESLTVGAWYVAIDLQLFALLLGALWLAGHARLAHRWRLWLGPLLVLALCLASLLVFNLVPELDIWAPYFFGAYGLGALVHWAGLLRRPRLSVLALVGLAALSLLVQFRERVALALATALVLGLAQQWLRARPARAQAPLTVPLAQLGQHSYSLFLVHFPICLLMNALFEQQGLGTARMGVVFMLATWLLANMASLPFHRWIEAPSGRLRLRLPLWLAPQGPMPR
jgi:peptidoglycan/LPS O-acetylase OafA/YrhL